MGIARYEIHVPVEARRATIATHQYLTGGQIPGVKAATVQYGYPSDLLIISGEETPELDSHVKQTGTLLGDVANLPWVEITKMGKNNAHWTMNNPHYQPEPVQAPPMFPQPVQGPMGAPQMQYAAGIADLTRPPLRSGDTRSSIAAHRSDTPHHRGGTQWLRGRTTGSTHTHSQMSRAASPKDARWLVLVG